MLCDKINHILTGTSEVSDMPFAVGENFRRSLLSEPETGMGYQHVRKVNLSAHLVILNAELVLRADGDYQINPEEAERFQEIYRPTDEVPGVREPDAPPYLDELETLDWDSSEFVVETHGSYVSNSLPGEKFVRFSAYNPDRRILQDGSLLPGTYATTDNDAGVVPSGLAAVGRYALPNLMPAIYHFNLVPSNPVTITCGTVAPANGQAGGGVEVCFNQGTAPRTLRYDTRIPER